MYYSNIYLVKKPVLSLSLIVLLFSGATLISSCHSKKKPPVHEIVETPEQMDEKIRSLIRGSLNYAIDNESELDDSVKVNKAEILKQLYSERSYNSFWSQSANWLPAADSVYNLIYNCRLYGLFPGHYHYEQLRAIREKFAADTLGKADRKDAALWTRADLMLSDALARMISDVKLGRLPKDSITQRKDTTIETGFFDEKFQEISTGASLTFLMDSLEPSIKGYQDIKAGIKKFLEKADFRDVTYIEYPDEDSLRLRKNLIDRLMELGYADTTDLSADSLRIASILKQYQKDKKLTVDGKIGPQTIRELNNSDKEKFIKLAITMDRYKMLPPALPVQYIWVNIPSFELKLIDDDTVVVTSRIVVGNPKTRTPVLTSSISELITYPKWTIPSSIIEKEILPALKRDPGYLLKKGYSLIKSDTIEVDPYTVDWSKYTKGIPYRVIQGSGDDNALGVLKFNFPNKYAVYLHDTNQRYYFSRSQRALSHGCVRVQDWEKLALYILTNDSLKAVEKKTKNFTPTDSVMRWLAVKEKHSVPLRNRVPLYIRYFTCEGVDGDLRFYDDVYHEDQNIWKNYLSGR